MTTAERVRKVIATAKKVRDAAEKGSEQEKQLIDTIKHLREIRLAVNKAAQMTA